MRAMKIVLTAIVLFALSFQAAAARGNSIPAAEPHSTVLVSADIDAITVAANSDTSVTFTVRNRDATQKTYDITCSATGSATVTSCIPDSLTIPASQSAMVTVSFHVGSGTGSVSVTAFGGIGDTGTASTTVSGGAPVAPVVAPDGGNTSLVTNSSTQVAFSIYNPNTTGSETYTLSCTSGGVVTCSASAPLSVAAQSYGTGYATIYSGSTTGSGSISFTATDQNGGASDGGSYNVTVQAAPQIQLSPSSAGYQYTQGAGTPAAQSVTISNSQGGTFTWTASPDESWISVSPTNGAQGTNVSISVNTEELAVGSYNGSVTVSAAGATNSPQSIAVALTVSPPPPIPPTVTPDGGTAAMHTSSTIPLNFVVYNDNNNARTYSLSCGYNGSPYVTGCAVTGPTEITVAAASSDTVTVTATSGTSAGSGSVSLTALDENGVRISDDGSYAITVTTLPVISPKLATLTFTAAKQSGLSAAQADSILGSGSFVWRASAHKSWVILNPTMGARDTVLQVQVNFGDALLANPGTYSDSITVADTSGVASSKVIAVTAVVTDPMPHIALSSTSLTLSAPAGGSDSAYVTVTNDGTGGSMSWSVSKTQPWLTLTPVSGAAGDRFLVKATAALLQGSSGTDDITVSAGTATNSPQHIQVAFSVLGGVIQLSADSFAVAGTLHGVTAIKWDTIRGAGYTRWYATSRNPWITLSAASGTRGTRLKLSTVFSDSALAQLGTYTGWVVITADSAAADSIKVVATVSRPRIILTPNTQAITMVTDSVGVFKTAITRTDKDTLSATLRWRASSDSSWIQLPDTIGKTKDTLVYTVHANQQPGVYVGRIVVRDTASFPTDTLGFTLPDTLLVTLTVKGRSQVPGNPRVASFQIDTAAGPLSQRDLCLTIAVAPNAAYECGDLRVVHALPSTRTMNKLRTPTLLYLSQTAAPQPLVPFDITLPSTANPSKVKVFLQVAGHSGRAILPYDSTYWLNNPTRTQRVVYTDSVLASLSTGVYDYTANVITVYPDSEIWTPPQSGTLLVVNRKTSHFGAGWALAGLEMLQFVDTDSSRILWVGGDASAHLYRRTSAGSSAWAGPSIDHPDTLLLNPDNTWTRKLPGGTRVIFNVAGLHIATINRLGHTTRFDYLNSSDTLSAIHLPVPTGAAPRNYSFDYSSGQVVITAPSPSAAQQRKDTLVISAATLLMLKDSLGSDSMKYSARRMTGYWSHLRHHAAFAYNATSHLLTTATRYLDVTAANIVHSFTPKESRGATSPVSLDSLVTVYDGPRASSDVNDVIVFKIDPFGGPELITDAISGVTVVRHGDAAFPALVTSVSYPARAAGVLTDSATYNDRGNILVSLVLNPHDDGNAPTQFLYDSTWPDFVTQTVSPTGLTSNTTYDPATGNRLHEDIGANGYRSADFAYFSLSDPDAPGLVRSVTTPREASGTVIETYTYDAFGNLASTTSPRGLRIETINDDAGRVRQRRVPFALNATPDFPKDVGNIQYSDYDSDDRLIETADSAGATGGAPAQSFSVRNAYDADGNLLTITRSGDGVDPIVTGFRYDLAGRKVADLAADATPTNMLDNPKDSVVYDNGSNITSSINRRGLSVSLKYDVLNRLQTHWRQMVSYDELQAVTDDVHTALVLPAEQDTFVYDGSSSAITYASSPDARTFRQYWLNGQLQKETQQIRTRDGTDFSQHQYDVQYKYDLEGRRTTLVLPQQITPLDISGQPQAGSQDSIQFVYDSDTGELLRITDPLKQSFTINHYASGTLQNLIRPEDVTETFGYDDDGNLTSDEIGGGIRSDALEYDASGRLLSAAGLDSAQYAYSGLGHTIYARSWTPTDGDIYVSSNHSANYSYDALGNQLSSQATDKEGFTDYAWICGQTNRCVWGNAGYQSLTNSTKYYGTGADASRLISDQSSFPKRTRHYSYDPSGNLELGGDSSVVDATAVQTRSYYDADNRLRVTSRADCIPAADGYTCLGLITDEEFRYDAFGRRVAVFTTRPPIYRQGNMISCPGADGFTDDPLCGANRDGETNGLVQRTIWDGDQELGEIQRLFSDESDALPATAVTIYPLVGNVSYTPGLRIDQPLSIVRSGYKDDDPADGVKLPYRAMLRLNAFSIMPYWDRQGMPTGAQYSSHPCLDETYNNCIFIAFPDAFSLSDRWRRTLTNGVDKILRYWYGSVFNDHKDATGLMYSRNRYYDPASGRFTQEDPIGLAGGINLYGYAGGDPINYSDPFGLDPCKTSSAWTECLAQAVANWGAQHGGLTGTIALNAGAALNAAMEATGINGAASTGDAIGRGDAAEGAVGVGLLLLPEGRSGKGLITPNRFFGSKTAEEAGAALAEKYGAARSVREGAETYFDSRTGRSYNIHTDPAHGAPHVDIRRRGPYPDRRVPLRETN